MHHDQDQTEISGSQEQRLQACEAAIESLGTEVRTQSLVITDERGSERITLGVDRGQAEIRLVASGRTTGADSLVILFAHGGDDSQEAGLGLQLWGDGNAVAALDAWLHSGQRWRASCSTDETGASSPGGQAP